MGNPAKAQLARAVRNPEEAFNTMRGSFFVVETKFDGRLPILTVVDPMNLQRLSIDPQRPCRNIFGDEDSMRPYSIPVLCK